MVKQRAGSAEKSEQALPLPDPKKLLRLYYAGLQMPSPQGGFFEPLRVRPEGNRTATVLLECNTSSLRYALSIPAATRTERTRVKAQQAEGQDPQCPRHGSLVRLNRVGKDLVCPLCGVAFGKV